MRYTFLASFAATLLATAAVAQGGGMGMMRADTNGDGMISRAEATAQANARFDAMDADKDGQLSSDEIRTWMEQARARAGRRHADPADAIAPAAPPPAPAPSPNPGQ